MRLLTLLTPALLATLSLANDSSSSEENASIPSAASARASKSSDATSSATTASSAEATAEVTPVGEIWNAKWKASDLSSYTKKCSSSSTYNAQLWQLADMYPGLKEWAPELKVFYMKQHYPGSWAGEDKHGNERELLKMDFEDIPFAVREWLKNHPKQRWFSVQDDVVFFAPGAIYPILPLWVEEAEGESLSECEGVFEDLENYSAELKDGVVVGRVEHKKKKERDIEFTVDAFQVVKSNAGAKDEL